MKVRRQRPSLIRRRSVSPSLWVAPNRTDYSLCRQRLPAAKPPLGAAPNSRDARATYSLVMWFGAEAADGEGRTHQLLRVADLIPLKAADSA